MTELEFTKTLSGCKFHQQFIEARYGEPKVVEKIIREIDWRERGVLKTRLFKECFAYTCLLAVAAVLFVIVPFCLVYVPYGKALIISFTPMMLCSMSRMFIFYKVYDMDRFIAFAANFGMMPARIAACCAWFLFCSTIPGIEITAMCLSMMFFYMIFAVPEMIMYQRFTANLEMTEEVEK